MDFSNEPYVRVYTRDTTNWRRMGWNGQCVLLQLLRKLDRSGALELDGLEPWEAVMLAIGCTEEVAKDGVGKLLFLKTAVIRGDLLVLPKHIEAQEAVKSDRLRQRESRERRAGGNPAEVTQRDTSSRNVTETHDSGRDVTEPGDASQPVTNGHSLLCSALPSSALLEGETRVRAVPPPDSSPPEREPGEPEAALADRVSLTALVRTRFEQSYAVRRGGPPAWPKANMDAARAIAAWLEPKGRTGEEYERILARVLTNFFADDRMETHAYPIAFLASDAEKHLNPPRRKGPGGGFTPPAPAEGFSGQEANLDDLFGKLKTPKGVANAR